MSNRIAFRQPQKNMMAVPFQKTVKSAHGSQSGTSLPEILFVTSYPPRECGIATYSHDLVNAMVNTFENSLTIRICALENNYENHEYSDEVKFILNTQQPEAYIAMANAINKDKQIALVVFQHEFGFYADCKNEFNQFLGAITKSKVMAFHTVLPNVDQEFRFNVISIADKSDGIIVMTQNAADILSKEYQIDSDKITVIPHGTHLVPHIDKNSLKDKYALGHRPILSTFGLLSSGKSIETTLDALHDVIKTKPDVLFLIIGKTHPGIIKREGEKYREFLQGKVRDLGLENNVKFINKYLPLTELLEYLQLTDIYLFTSKDRNQAVSGTFSYAASCGCAIISTPIPHAVEFLSGDSGIVVEFENPTMLSDAIHNLLSDENLRQSIKLNALHKIVATAWENAAAAHASLFSAINDRINTHYRKPAINLDHIAKMTTDFGMLQFSKLNHPDASSGYTLDDNARAMIAMCNHYELTKNHEDLNYIGLYLNFISYCQQPDGTFLNYVDQLKNFTEENKTCNLDDSNGRAIWSLGYLISIQEILPTEFGLKAQTILENAMPNIEAIHSTRAMAFIIKGLHYYNTHHNSTAVRSLVKKLADRLTQMYLHESTRNWEWFESYMTYANSLLPEALLFAYKETKETMYKEVARITFDFLLSKTFTYNGEIRVVSNQSWLNRGTETARYGEQPIDVAYTILALNNFSLMFSDSEYTKKMEAAFEWFLGRNHLGQIIYNPCTGGCYDGLEEHNVNLNQGAESAVSYLLARLCMEKNAAMRKARELTVIKIIPEQYAFNA